MRVRMKLVVPLTMPMTRRMRSPASDLAQGPDERDATPDGRFEQEVDAGRGRGLEELGAVVGQQLLVAGDDRLARLDGGEDEGAGRLDAADDLHDHVDLGIDHHRLGIVGQAVVGHGHRPGLGRVAHCHAGQLEAYAGAGLDGVGVGREQLHEAATHVPAAEHPDPHRTVRRSTVHTRKR